jgi:hypothetical protein
MELAEDSCLHEFSSFSKILSMSLPRESDGVGILTGSSYDMHALMSSAILTNLTQATSISTEDGEY